MSADAQKVIKKKKRRRSLRSGSWSYRQLRCLLDVRWMLEIEFRFSVRAVLPLNHRATAPVPLFIPPPTPGNGRDTQTNTIASNEDQYVMAERA